MTTTPRIEHLPPAELKPWARNARKHSRKQLRQIADSIREFGFTNPVLIDETRTILAGHGRVDAVARDKKWRKLGLAPFKSIFKPAAGQVAFEMEQNKPDAEGTETTLPPARATEDDQNLTAERTEQSWIDRFGLLSRLPEDVRADLEASTTIASVPAGAEVFAPGQSAENVLVVLYGTIRVQRPPENGRRPLPFDLEPGEPCILALSSEIAIEDYGANGIAATDVTVAVIPSAVFVDVFTRSPDFRMFVFEH